MNIMVVTQCFYPDVYAINDIVRSLVKRGHKVTVLTGLPDYTTSKIPKEYKFGRNRHQNYYGADVYRVPTIARHHGAIWRSLNYISFAVTGSIAALLKNWNDFDLIYVWEVSPVTMIYPAITLKKKYKKKLFVYCLDIWPECVKAMGFKEKTFAYRLIHIISKKAYQSADHIAVSSKPFFEYLHIVNGIDRRKMSYLPQFASEDMLKMNLSKIQKGHFDFLYIGNIGKAQDIPCMVRAISRLENRNEVTFHIVGNGSEYENMVQLAKKTGAIKIMKFYGAKPFDEAIKFYRFADACILTLDGSNHIGDTLPGKLQTYMAAGKPVLGALNGAGQQIINESHCGKCVNAGDADGLAHLFLDYIHHADTYNECGNCAKEYFLQNFTERKHFERFEKILKKMSGEYENFND